MKRLNELLEKFSVGAARVVGTSWAFVGALLVVIAWAVTGPPFGYSERWQLVINTGTTIVTFLMVFLIQRAHGIDTKALHLKMDEVVRAIPEASNDTIHAEKKGEAELKRLDGGP